MIVSSELPLRTDSDSDDHTSLASMRDDEAQRLVCGDNDEGMVDVPLICVAYSAEEMYDVMASGLSQRRYLGTNTPLVGIILRPYDTRLQLVVGWSESEGGSVISSSFVAVSNIELNN